MRDIVARRNQIAGCLVGGALGDAWGGPWEGQRGPIVFQVPVQSELSDDTQLTLATCESILEVERVDPEHLAARLAKWFNAGRITGIGASTLKAMRDLTAGVHWALAGSRGERAAGNGAAMRIAPLAFLMDPAEPVARTTIRDVCRITHHNDEAYLGALAVVLAIRAVVSDTWSTGNNFLVAAARVLPDSAVRERIEEIRHLRSHPVEVASRFGSSGYVVDSVPLALYCAQFIAEQPLVRVIAQAVEAGGDTDTVASITGQIAGTVAGVPQDYKGSLDRIAGGAEVMQIAKEFAEFAAARDERSSS